MLHHHFSTVTLNGQTKPLFKTGVFASSAASVGEDKIRRVEGIQSATSLLDAAKYYTLDL